MILFIVLSAVVGRSRSPEVSCRVLIVLPFVTDRVLAILYFIVIRKQDKESREE